MGAGRNQSSRGHNKALHYANRHVPGRRCYWCIATNTLITWHRCYTAGCQHFSSVLKARGWVFKGKFVNEEFCHLCLYLPKGVELLYRNIPAEKIPMRWLSFIISQCAWWWSPLWIQGKKHILQNNSKWILWPWFWAPRDQLQRRAEDFSVCITPSFVMRCEKYLLPASVTRQTIMPNNVCRLTPMERERASTPPVGQWPAGWQLHTLMVNVLVLERAGAPLSVITTGRRYWLRSLRVKVLLRALMLAVLSKRRVQGEKHDVKLKNGNKAEVLLAVCFRVKRVINVI